MTTEEAAARYLVEHIESVSGRPVAVFNPNNIDIEKLPVIYAFSNTRGGGDGTAYAIAEDGECLGSHWCSNEGYVPSDLGVLEGCRDDRHETYRKHYPDGYRMAFIRSTDVLTHPGLTIAIERCRNRAENENPKECKQGEC